MKGLDFSLEVIFQIFAFMTWGEEKYLERDSNPVRVGSFFISTSRYKSFE